ncbi:MAG: caspase family protein, partial [Leptospira sp.]|nr:caspase family protein [Leptospira sp.]
NIVTGFTAWGIDQFAYKFNRPDLILERAGMGNKTLLTHYFNRFKKRLNRAGLSESDVNSEMDVPTATIIAHSVVKDVANLRIGLQDEKYSIRNYNIYVNDVPLFGSKGKKTDGTKVFIEEQFQLTPGKNKIEVTCLNSRGAESLRSLVYLFSSYTPKEKGDLYYLGFGVSRYKNTELNLQFADKDAKDLAGVFGGFEKKSFSGFHSRIYLNEEATVENVRKAKEFLKNAKPADTVVLFIAGHGLHDRDKESTYYFLTHETDLTKLADTAANFELIEEILQEIAPRNKLFLIDTCESGETEDETVSRNLITAKSRGLSPRTIRSINVIAKGKSPDKPRTFLFETDRYIYNDLLRRSGAVVFSSSKGGEFSYESAEIQNGFFTSELIHALRNRKADRNGDGIISTDELKAIVIQEVSKKTNGLQNPTVDKDNIYQKFGF